MGGRRKREEGRIGGGEKNKLKRKGVQASKQGKLFSKDKAPDQSCSSTLCGVVPSAERGWPVEREGGRGDAKAGEPDPQHHSEPVRGVVPGKNWSSVFLR